MAAAPQPPHPAGGALSPRREPRRRIRVLLADDHRLVREGLSSMLPPAEFEVVGEASTGREATALALDLRPDVILMDVRMPDIDGLSALAAIKRDLPDVPVLMVSTYENTSYVVRAVANGAAGYLLKGVSREELLRAIRRAVAGESVMDPAAIRSAVKGLIRASAAGNGGLQGMVEPLTPRELDVLGLLSEGLTNRKIGDLLGISEGTARAHVQSIIQKLGVADRTQAAVWAVKQGLIR